MADVHHPNNPEEALQRPQGPVHGWRPRRDDHHHANSPTLDLAYLGESISASERGQRSRRRLSREAAIQGVYCWLVTGTEPEKALNWYLEQDQTAALQTDFLQRLILGVLEKQAALYEALEPHVQRPFAEITPVEHAVLLVSTLELMFESDVPFQVVLNEAIEITKIFGGPDGHRFVNGVLDRVAAATRRKEVQIQRLSHMARRIGPSDSAAE